MDFFFHSSDPYRSKLRRLELRNTNITNEGFCLLAQHNLRELRLHNCLYLTDEILSELNSHSDNLVELSIEPAAGVLPAYLPSLKGEYRPNYVIVSQINDNKISYMTPLRI